MSYAVYVDGQEGTTGLRIHECLAAARRRRAAANRPRAAQGSGRARAPAQRGRRGVPVPARRRGARGGRAGRPTRGPASSTPAPRTAPRRAGPSACPSSRRSSAPRSARAPSASPIPAATPARFILLLRPLVDAGLVPPRRRVTATSITGYSGGGKKMIAAVRGGRRRAARRRRGPTRSPRAQAPARDGGAHRPRRRAGVHADRGDFYKGLAVMVPLHLRSCARAPTPRALHAALAARYAGERFVRVMPLARPRHARGGFFDVQGCNDTNRVDLFVFGNEDAGAAHGAARQPGQGRQRRRSAVMNVHLGLDEGLGL